MEIVELNLVIDRFLEDQIENGCTPGEALKISLAAVNYIAYKRKYISEREYLKAIKVDESYAH